MVSISEQLQSCFDYCNHLFVVLTVVDRGGTAVAPPLPRQELSLLREQTLGSARGPGREVCIPEQSLAKRQPRPGEHPTPAPGGAAAGVRAHGEARTTFCSLSANTAGSKHLLLHLSSNHCLQALL